MVLESQGSEQQRWSQEGANCSGITEDERQVLNDRLAFR